MNPSHTLSVIVVAYNMARELPRTLTALAAGYQQSSQGLSHEVIVVDNGSNPPVALAALPDIGVPLRVLTMDQPNASPAAAVNRGITAAEGDLVCIMIDGAHILTPGVLRWTHRAFLAFDEPLVAVPYFYLGPGDQPETVLNGYDQAYEDHLLQRIDWPEDGYRLFAVGAALRSSQGKVTWLNRLFESNCLSLRRSLALELGGMDEAFDLPGGGMVNLDFFKRAAEHDRVSLVQLVGEGSFHQVHGGTTTNSQASTRATYLQAFREQYEQLRGTADTMTKKLPYFLGHIPNDDAKINQRQCGRLARLAPAAPEDGT